MGIEETFQISVYRMTQYCLDFMACAQTDARMSNNINYRVAQKVSHYQIIKKIVLKHVNEIIFICQIKE